MENRKGKTEKKKTEKIADAQERKSKRKMRSTWEPEKKKKLPEK
jgi:hypothetical protein